MRKLLAILLVIAMVVPMGIVSHADGVAKKGFYTVNWTKPEVDFDYVYYMPYTYIKESDVSPTSTEVDIIFTIYDTTDVNEMAKRLKADFDARPEGTRYFNFMALQTVFFESRSDIVDMEKGVALTKDWLTRFLTAYKNIGGKLDGIAVDLEYFRALAYYINYSEYAKGNKDVYNQIVGNKVYQNRIRPELVKRGFEFYPASQQGGEKSEIWTISYSSEGNDQCRAIWDQVTESLLVDYINEAAFEPLMKFYPDASLSDYKTGDLYSWYKEMSHTGSESTMNNKKAGNTSNYNVYDYPPGYVFYGFNSETDRSKRTKYQKPASYNDAVFVDDPFNRTLWGVNNHKRMLASTDTGKMSSWIAFYHYGESGTGYSDTPYYSEILYHVGMTDPDPFLGYILKGEVIAAGEDHPDPDACEFDVVLQVVDEIMADLTRVAGYADRKPIITPINWNQGFILSGMYANGRNIWRITPDTAKVSKADFKVDGADPTFSIEGTTITFPGGKIINDGKVSKVGTCGYWVETPADVNPIVTADPDRYSKYPAFEDTFNTYKTGTFTAASVLPETYWEISGSASIKANGENKMLALSGDASVTNVKVPKLITAGDEYAKQQAWEVTVTLPEENYGDVTLFSCAEGDGGIKISGGKVYYDKAGSYEELCSVSTGTYTFKRELDFRTANGYTSTYTVIDTQGNAVGKTDAVAMASIAIPVTTIKLATSGAETAVMLDNYKLYPTGVTTVLELFDAAYGMELTDLSTERTADTAYRLSWMNASSETKTVKIVEAKSGNVIETLEMTPGMDGVATGIVNADGKAIQIKLEEVVNTPSSDGTGTQNPNGTGDGNGSANNVDAGNNGNQPGNHAQNAKKQGSDLWLWILLAVTVLIGAGTAVYLFVIHPKKNKE